MANKTPICVLHELCAQENERAPIYGVLSNPADSNAFTYVVTAFDISAQGSGRSKREAKHKASAELISCLKKLNRFKNKLKESPSCPLFESDAISTLLDICVQRSYPMASFEVQQTCGHPHTPEYTAECRIASITQTGTFSTKKGAKQMAAKAMLQLFQDSPAQSHQQIGKREPEPVEKTLRTYREHKNPDIKSVAVRLRNRHNYFLRLPAEDRSAAYNILMGNVTQCDTAKNIVDLACKALKIEYEVIVVDRHPKQHLLFIMKGDYDCVLTGSASNLYEEIVDYLKTMLNFQQIKV